MQAQLNRTAKSGCATETSCESNFFARREQAAEKLKLLSFRGALRAEESLFSCVSSKERFLASLGMTI
jgi:hypothetical protein